MRQKVPIQSKQSLVTESRILDLLIALCAKQIGTRLVVNFQPRMNLGRKRFNEEREASEEASNYNKQIGMEHRRE